MNNQFEALKAPKNRFSLFLSHFLCTKTISFTFSLYSSKKKTKILILNFLRFIEPFKLKILGHQQVGRFRGTTTAPLFSKIHTSLISVWTSISRAHNLCVLEEANQVISLVEGMKSIFYRYVRQEDFRISLLVIEDLYENLLVMRRLVMQLTLCMFFREEFLESLPTFLC